MIGDPKIDTRNALHTAGIRANVPISDFPIVIPQLLNEVFGWLAEHNIAPDGPPFLRMHRVSMSTRMDVELGVIVAEPITGSGHVAPGIIPAGRYASLIYTGIENGIPGNAALLNWGKAQGLVWDMIETENGDAFGGRVEFFLDGPDDDPNPANWRTEVAIRLKDS